MRAIEQALEVGASAALGDEPAARPERPVDAREQAVVIEDPMKRGRAVDGIECLDERQRSPVAAHEHGSLTAVLAGFVHHRRGPIESHDDTSRPDGDFFRQTSGAAPEIENALVGPRVQAVEDFAPPAKLGVRKPVIARRVPVRHQSSVQSRHRGIRMRLFCVAVTAVLLAASTGGVGARQAAAPGVRLGDLSWVEAERALTADTVVVIPLGAGAKEHGPHLRLDNDLAIANYLSRRVLEQSAVVVAPPVTYHFYPAFIEYPGSTTLNLETARTLTIEVVRSLARYGPRRFYVLNTGVSTSRPIGAAAEALAGDGILLGYTDLAPRLDEVSARVRQEEGGTHADEVETSMMLYIDPTAVDMTRAVKEFMPSTGPLRLTRTKGNAGTYSASGVWGDATLATRDKGRVIVEGLVATILNEIDVVRHARLPVPSPPSRGPATSAATPPRTQFGEDRMPSGCTPGDERSIRNIGNMYAVNWRNGDALALADMWSEQGDMVHPDGLVERGRETIRTNRAAMFARREYRGSQHLLTVGNIRCVSSDVAVVDGKWELRGVSDSAGKPLPAFEGQMTLVIKRAGTWLIEAYRYTLKPTPVPPPTWLKRPGWPGLSE